MCLVSSKKDGKINGCIVNTMFQIVPEPVLLLKACRAIGFARITGPVKMSLSRLRRLIL